MMISSQSFFFIFFLSLILNNLASPTLQRDALLEFKTEFPFSALDPESPSSFSLSSWNTSSDHCSWKGVTCDAKSGEVISLVLENTNLNGSLKANTSLLKLQHLQHLTLVSCNLKGEIPSSLGNLSRLEHLEIFSNDDLGGEIPSSIGNLSHLKHLDLCYNNLTGEIPFSIGNLSHLIHLGLDQNHLVGKIPSSIGNLSHLSELYLTNNNLVGKIPFSLGNLSRLTDLILAENHLIGEIPPSIGNPNQLIFMRLGSNNLSGNIPSSFANFKKLSILSLSDNQLVDGDLPLILSNLTSLSYLDISYNHFKSTLPSDMSGLHNLEEFDASENSFFGNVPTSLFKIPSLLDVSLRGNQIEGPLEFWNTSSSSQLYHLDLASNNFHGPIPEDIFRFLSLKTLDLSHNSFIGSIPGSISKLVSLYDVDLSYNKLEGQVPSFLWRLSYLKLSHNSFSSLEESVLVFDNGSHSDLSSTSFQGQVLHVDLGSNSLQGSFPQWICKSTSLSFLDLSNNHLSGSIPSCLMNCTASLGDIILRNNNLSGFLPDIFSNATKLRSLDVSHNQLVGKVPKSLINCKSMEFLNLKGNKFKDTFPSWLSSLGSLGILFLGSNAFYGPISSSSHFGFPSLRVIDISHNSFNGTLPEDYFVNWLKMSSVGVYEPGWPKYLGQGKSYPIYVYLLYLYYHMDMMYKGVDTEFPQVFFEYKAIDFSGNKFTGQIPKSIGMLNDLIHVNFSRNAFTGSIPSSLANLSNLEALDLSYNKLSGNIPHDLAKLSFVSYLDFSHNLLQGSVPRSTQFQSQNCSSFEDNLGLYGFEENCRETHAPDPTSGDSQPSEEFPSEEVLNWIAAAIAFGPGVFCGLVIGYIFCTSHKHIWFLEKFRRNYPRGIITVR